MISINGKRNIAVLYSLSCTIHMAFAKKIIQGLSATEARGLLRKIGGLA